MRGWELSCDLRRACRRANDAPETNRLSYCAWGADVDLTEDVGLKREIALSVILERLTSRGKLLTAEQASNTVRHIALTPGLAHDADSVHQAVKSNNELIRPDGTAVLVDVGIEAVGSKW
jgi:tRNA A-37 threonylcarbamoyl transferase component Bud32